MPEGPEVKKYADELAACLDGRDIRSISARTKNAKAWLVEHGDQLIGRKIQSVFSHGKNIIGIVHGGYYFYSHQMMWGRWNVFIGDENVASDRRERARIVVKGATAVLMSAPIFEVGAGDPYENLEYLAELGPDILDRRFKRQEFQSRLTDETNLERTIGDALLDQKICAGIGNYLRAEILFVCRIDPWKRVADLTETEVSSLAKAVPEITKLSYEHSRTVPVELRERMSTDHSLVYVPGKEYGTRHYVFRRTNLPCLLCNQPIRQLRQETKNLSQNVLDNDLKSRIVYFCQNCQKVSPNVLGKKPAKLPSQSQKIKRTIMRLLAERGDNKTICPSEVARVIDPENWRKLMPAVRAAAEDLLRRKRIVALQKNMPVQSALSAKGAIRLALVQ